MIRRHDTRTIDGAQAKAQLASLLAGAVTLDNFTVESLSRINKTPAKEIEYMLQIARQKRAAAG